MKKHLLLILILSFILTNVACGTSSGDGESEVGGDETVTFQATILEIQEGYYLVEPMEGSAELNSADQIIIPMINMNPSSEPEVGDVLEIEYDGSIAESYPAQIVNVYSIRVVELGAWYIEHLPEINLSYENSRRGWTRTTVMPK